MCVVKRLVKTVLILEVHGDATQNVEWMCCFRIPLSVRMYFVFEAKNIESSLSTITTNWQVIVIIGIAVICY